MLQPPLHTPQIEDGYCVPACARMALSQYLDYGPVSVGTDAFLLGWVERDNTCALFSRKGDEE